MNVVADILRKSADVIRKYGYTKGMRGSLDPTQGPHCALGAIDAVCDSERYDWGHIKNVRAALVNCIVDKIPEQGIYDEYNETLVLEYSDSASIIAAWNNMLCTNKEDVATAMEECAAGLTY